MFTAHDYEFMALALRLAERGLYTTDPNPRVGCVLVKESQVIGEGWHQKTGAAHAEVIAIADANRKAKEASKAATAYITLEPCSHYGKTPPCINALIEAGVQRVVIAAEDPNPLVAGKGIAALQAAGVKVESGLLADQSRQLNCGFIMRMEQKRPYVRLKSAMSLDGKTALATGESRWITSEAARVDVQKLRARSSAIVTGVNTVIKDDPELNVRWSEVSNTAIRQPLRIILDSELKTPVNARILREPGQVLIVTSTQSLQNQNRYSPAKNVEVIGLEGDKNGRPDIAVLLTLLAAREVNELHVESGATLAGEFVAGRWVDEFVFYMAPVLLGNDAQSLLKLPVLNSMNEKISLNIKSITRIGKDYRINVTPENV